MPARIADTVARLITIASHPAAMAMGMRMAIKSIVMTVTVVITIVIALNITASMTMDITTVGIRDISSMDMTDPESGITANPVDIDMIHTQGVTDVSIWPAMVMTAGITEPQTNAAPVIPGPHLLREDA